MPFMQANTGLDPHGNYSYFIKKDVVPNIDVHQEGQRSFNELYRTQFQANKGRWALGTTKHTRDKVDDTGKLVWSPEMKRSASQQQDFRLKTDVISFKPPTLSKPFQDAYDKLVTSPPKFGINS